MFVPSWVYIKCSSHSSFSYLVIIIIIMYIYKYVTKRAEALSWAEGSDCKPCVNDPVQDEYSA